MVGPGEESKVAIVCWSLPQFAKVCHILLEETLANSGKLEILGPGESTFAIWFAGVCFSLPHVVCHN